MTEIEKLTIEISRLEDELQKVKSRVRVSSARAIISSGVLDTDKVGRERLIKAEKHNLISELVNSLLERGIIEITARSWNDLQTDGIELLGAIELEASILTYDKTES
jgi:signal transduction histidine kinase